MQTMDTFIGVPQVSLPRKFIDNKEVCFPNNFPFGENWHVHDIMLCFIRCIDRCLCRVDIGDIKNVLQYHTEGISI